MKLENAKSEISRLKSQFEHTETQKMNMVESSKKAEALKDKKITELKSINNQLKIDVKTLVKKSKEKEENSQINASLTEKLQAELDAVKIESQKKNTITLSLKEELEDLKNLYAREKIAMTQEVEKYQNEITHLQSIVSEFQDSRNTLDTTFHEKDDKILNLSNKLSSANGELKG